MAVVLETDPVIAVVMDGLATKLAEIRTGTADLYSFDLPPENVYVEAESPASRRSPSVTIYEMPAEHRKELDGEPRLREVVPCVLVFIERESSGAPGGPTSERRRRARRMLADLRRHLARGFAVTLPRLAGADESVHIRVEYVSSYVAQALTEQGQIEGYLEVELYVESDWHDPRAY